MNELDNVSHQAFIEQIQNWELTLSREMKKLRQLRKITTNKLQANTIDITLINIQSEMIQYKKIRENKISSNHSVIQIYTTLSKRFMNIMQKIGESVQNDRYAETTNLRLDDQKTEENNCPNRTKHFLEETFSHKMSKQPSKKKNKSMIQYKKKISSLIREKETLKEQSRTKKMLDTGKQNRDRLYSNFFHLQQQEEQDLSDIRYQLKQIKSMMTQMQKEIKLHNHEQLDKQINKLSSNNKKLTLQIKNIKQDNQFLLARMQNIKDEINHQKNVQTEMIKKIQAGRESKSRVNELSKQKNPKEGVSDWVKIRI